MLALRQRMMFWFLIFFLVILIGSSVAYPRTTVLAQERQPLEDPYMLISNGVMDYDINGYRLVFYGRDNVSCAPTRAPDTETEWFARIATYGGDYRELWTDTYNPWCTSFDVDPLSNLVTDNYYVYWVSASKGGLVRLSQFANVGDEPQLMTTSASGTSMLVEQESYIYSLNSTGLRRTSKSTYGTSLLVGSSSIGSSPTNFKTDGKYLYWMANSGVLKRYEIATDTLVDIATGVTGYYPEGRLLLFCTFNPFVCTYTEYVFIGKEHQIVRYNNIDSSSTTIYTASDTSAEIYELVTTETGLFTGQLFFFETTPVVCSLWCDYQVKLIRHERGSGGTTDTLYAYAAGIAKYGLSNLRIQPESNYLFWQEEGGVARLPSNADSLPMTNLKITGIEVNQAIQDINHSVTLIRGKRTFVRLYVSSDGGPVEGVTARLYRLNDSGTPIGSPLAPVNPIGQHITVKKWANRQNINHSFLFELPNDWVSGTTLRLRGVLNPWHMPLESNYVDNVKNFGPFTLNQSPRLGVYFVSFGYKLNNKMYWPRLIEDIFQTYSWIRRVYPLASSSGGFSNPSPGFRPNLWFVNDAGLGSRVNFTAAECNKYPFYYKDNEGKQVDRRNLCASAYTNNLMIAMRIENGIPANIFMYGMISDAAGYFPRGQAFSEHNVSSGPAGNGTWGWDFDNSYADWYAGHEIGHTLQRWHPVASADDPDTEVEEGCGHSPDDADYPYSTARISNGPAEGFDVGNPGLNPLLKPAVLPALYWYDLMSYCNNQWISDYNYEAMYEYMLAHPTSLHTPVVWHSGDFLSIYGIIEPESKTVSIQRLRRLSEVSEIPFYGRGTYTIRLVDSEGNALADYLFTPSGPVDDAELPYLSFAQVVEFVNGTTAIQILDDTETVLTTVEVSPNAPEVGEVTVPENLRSVQSAVITWQATDADGDTLTYDVLYSSDGGAGFVPIVQGLSQNHYDVNFDDLPGSDNAVLRVIASDGVNTASADSASFVVNAKPPVVEITSPADGASFLYDQTVNLTGMAYDLQDGEVDSANWTWLNQNGVLGTDETLSLSQLPIGEHQITLQATNSHGVTDSDSITILITDTLDLPGPILSVSPTEINWHVGVENLVPQTAELLIDNVGGGSLANWIASENASWLTLSNTGGVVSSTLMITANPSIITPGTAVQTTLTISTPANGDTPAQSVDVTIILAVGNVWEESSPSPRKIYLPFLVR